MAKRIKSKTVLTTKERFELFVRRVDELNELRLVRDQATSSMHFSFDAETSSLKISIIEPDQDDLRSFLVSFRKFISDDESTFVSRVFNDCLRYSIHDEMKQEVSKAKDEWNVCICKGVMELQINHQTITSEHALDVWINGHYFHDDPDKITEIDGYSKGLLPLIRTQFNQTVIMLTKIIQYLGGAIAVGLGNDYFSFPDNKVE